jgi:aspartate-semialdehyde dehydrogenase
MSARTRRRVAIVGASGVAGQRFSVALEDHPWCEIAALADPFQPQPCIGRSVNDGMTRVVGRLREDAVLPRGVKFVLLSHNTRLGAAKGAVLTAETLVHQGLA